MVGLMEGFYTKAQAARILGVSTRQVDNYIKDGKLRRVKEKRKAWVPKEDVDLLYKNKELQRVPTLQEITHIQQQVDQLTKQVKILQRGLGFGSGGAPRSDVELRLLYQQVMDDLGEPGWPIPRIMEFTEEITSIREEDMDGLLRLRGNTALLPFFDLARRMIGYIERHDQYPSFGTQAVRDRLLQARRVLLALVEINLRIETPTYTEAAKALYSHLGERADFISTYIGDYVVQNY
jgi:hypothetical protein